MKSKGGQDGAKLTLKKVGGALGHRGRQAAVSAQLAQMDPEGDDESMGGAGSCVEYESRSKTSMGRGAWPGPEAAAA